MSTGNISLDLLLNDILEVADIRKDDAVRAIQKRYPSLNYKEAEEISTLILKTSSFETKEDVSLIITAPTSFSLKAKSTKNTVIDMLTGAQRSILITGYSLSDYFSDLIDVIIQKSQSGVFIKFFINNMDKQKNIDKLIRYKGQFLKIYNFISQSDFMANLHAKVISVDQKHTLITSANLSYHGQEGNIEFGTYIKSHQIAKQVEDIFTQLIFSKFFIEIK